jgi:hypothetical protein
LFTRHTSGLAAVASVPVTLSRVVVKIVTPAIAYSRQIADSAVRRRSVDGRVSSWRSSWGHRRLHTRVLTFEIVIRPTSLFTRNASGLATVSSVPVTLSRVVVEIVTPAIAYSRQIADSAVERKSVDGRVSSWRSSWGHRRLHSRVLAFEIEI